MSVFVFTMASTACESLPCQLPSGVINCNNACIHELVKLLKEKKVLVPFIGAGLSCWAGIKFWSSLLKTLGKELTGDEKKLFDEKMKNSLYEEAAKLLIENMGDSLFKERIIQECSIKPGSVRPKFQVLIPYIFNFGPMITSNYDDCLEKLLNEELNLGYEVIYSEVFLHEDGTENTEKIEEIAERFRNNEKILLHLHGSIRKPSSIVIDTNSYDKFYGKAVEGPLKGTREMPLEKLLEGKLEGPLSHFLQLIFQSVYPVFIGCGLRRDRMYDVLVKALNSSRPSTSVDRSFSILGYYEDDLEIRSPFQTGTIYYPPETRVYVSLIIKYLARSVLDKGILHNLKDRYKCDTEIEEIDGSQIDVVQTVSHLHGDDGGGYPKPTTETTDCRSYEVYCSELHLLAPRENLPRETEIVCSRCNQRITIPKYYVCGLCPGFNLCSDCARILITCPDCGRSSLIARTSLPIRVCRFHSPDNEISSDSKYVVCPYCMKPMCRTCYYGHHF